MRKSQTSHKVSISILCSTFPAKCESTSGNWGENRIQFLILLKGNKPLFLLVIRQSDCRSRNVIKVLPEHHRSLETPGKREGRERERDESEMEREREEKSSEREEKEMD